MNTKIFCDIAELDQIKKFNKKKIVKGFTTNPSLMRKAGAKDYKSYSKKNVIRGLHIQLRRPQGKFVSVLKGAILDVAVDLRKNSKTFGKYFKIILSRAMEKLMIILRILGRK